MWGCMRVRVNRNRGRYCFLFSKGPILNDIRGHTDPKNIYQIAGNQNFLGDAPRPPAGARAFGARFGASHPYRAPLSKIPGSAPAVGRVIWPVNTASGHSGNQRINGALLCLPALIANDVNKWRRK